MHITQYVILDLKIQFKRAARIDIYKVLTVNTSYFMYFSKKCIKNILSF